MGSVPKPRCARGSDCYHVRNLRSEKPASVAREGVLCEKCGQENKGALRAPNKAKWVDDKLEAIERVRAKSSQGKPIGEASLWDLFKLDNSPRWGRPSDFGEALGSLDAKTLVKLTDWLAANAEEAVERYKRRRYVPLCITVRLIARLSALPPDKPLVAQQSDKGLPLAAMACKRSGRGVDQTVIINLARLRRAPRFFSERDLEEELGVPRSTLRRMMERMDEIGFSLDSFTPDDVAYIAFGKTRGRKRSS